MRRPRVALLTEIPAPYRIPLFNALARRLDIHVVFLARRNPERPYELPVDEMKFAWSILPSRDLELSGRWLVLNAGVRRTLRGADVVMLGGWNQPAFWTAWLGRAPRVGWIESTLRDARGGRAGAGKRLFARGLDAAIVPGTAAAEYVRAIAPQLPLVFAPNAVDNELFASRLADRDTLRATFGLQRPCVLYAGRLAPEKGVDVLIAAARELEADVAIAGAGSEGPPLRAAASTNVRFLGQLDRRELAGWYAAADVLCQPSRSEPWGFPLNEGAAAGLPLVATDCVGAAWDLIEEGVNGMRVPAGDAAALRDALARFCADDTLRANAGARSRELSAAFTAEAWAEAVAGLVTRLATR